MTRHNLTLKPSGKTRSFPEGTCLADALADMGVMLRTPCGGKGTCGKCRVKATGVISDLSSPETGPQHVTSGLCPACRTNIAGDVRVYIDELHEFRRKTYPSVDPDARYSIAVDIGTTIVKISLVDCIYEKYYLLDSFLNPQRHYGHDVISRIAASSDPKVFHSLAGRIRRSVFSTVEAALNAMSVEPERIDKIVISGNTTMLYLFFGLDVNSLGRFPYKTAHRDFNEFSPQDLGTDPFGSAMISSLPVHSAFLGADIVGGLALCRSMGFFSRVFFIDLGTNGEIFLINPAGEIYATSCAMGPALEGMNITWGMTAEGGAITHIDLEDDNLRYHMIGNEKPVGVTGTAIIDILSIMLENNIIRKNGAFPPDLQDIHLPAPMACVFDEDIPQIRLWGDIAVTQRDIRNVQLAKGASLAASRILLTAAGCRPDQIEHVIIAGAFGEHLNIEHFKTLGFIPEFQAAIWHFLGNTSLKAAQQACCNNHFCDDAGVLRDSLHEVILSQYRDFGTEFVAAMDFL
jgi:uncharacterized 2Fe-2S/4Fe-4S cluster protein (DUF4445 family)